MFTHIAFYKFVSILNTQELRSHLLELCERLNLKGTILLAEEGINTCLVGPDENISEFIVNLESDQRFSGIDFKKSTCSNMPYRRMLVKLKKEIIPMNDKSVQPERSTGQYVSALELKSWLDNASEEVVLLDTRNDYEVEVGTFRAAINPHLQTFREFPDWVAAQLNQNEDWKNKKIVTFCTGGIRCEKATAFMEQIGYKNVYQLQGGILKYFEETAHNTPNEDNHFDGECFVFDYRVALNKTLDPTTRYSICYNCWNTLTQEDLKRPEYKPKLACHKCAHR